MSETINITDRQLCRGGIKIKDFVTFVETRFIASVVAVIYYVVHQAIVYSAEADAINRVSTLNWDKPILIHLRYCHIYSILRLQSRCHRAAMI